MKDPKVDTATTDRFLLQRLQSARLKLLPPLSAFSTSVVLNLPDVDRLIALLEGKSQST